MVMKRIIFLAIFFLTTLSCTSAVLGIKKSLWTGGVSPAFTEVDTRWADSLLDIMSTEEKISQLLVLDQTNIYNATEILQSYGAGGFCGSGEEFGRAIATVQERGSIPPFYMAAAMDAALFRKWGIPDPSVIDYMEDHAVLHRVFKTVSGAQRHEGVNFVLGPYLNLGRNQSAAGMLSSIPPVYQSVAKESGLMCASGIFPYLQTPADVEYTADSVINLFQAQVDAGVQAILVSPHFFAQTVTGNLEPIMFDMRAAVTMLRKKMLFQGLVLSYIPDSLSGYSGALAVEAIASGCNMVINVANPRTATDAVLQSIASGRISMKSINSLCRQVLLAKWWIHISSTGYYPSTAYLDSPEGVQKTVARESITVLKNVDSTLPVNHLGLGKFATVHIGKQPPLYFHKMLSQYAEFDHLESVEKINISTISLLIAKASHYRQIFITIDSALDAWQSNLLSNMSEMLYGQTDIILILLNEDCDISHLQTRKFKSVVLSPHNDQLYQQELAQVLFGALPAKGRIPYSFSRYPAGTGVQYPANGRLRYTVPEESGMNSVVLTRIDSIVKYAIKMKATPGCQVLIARSGAVVFERSYGYHTYESKIPVQNSHLYDIASLTKVAATTISLMRLEDEKLFSTDSKMQDYLPYLDLTDKGPLLLSDVLTHQAKLYPWIPFYLTLIEGYDDPAIRITSTRHSKEHSVRAGNNFYLKTGYRYRPGYLSDHQDSLFSIEVAKGLFINKWFVDSMFCRIDNSVLKDSKKYLYSDLGFIYLRKLIEKQIKTPLEKYTDSVFYGPLGAYRLGYLPLRRYADTVIVPTEDDLIFRRQVLRGYVHDPGAAMLGGVSGHAGLFSNANDLAKLSQMLLNGGTYGGQRFIEKRTISKYTGCPYCNEGNRRGFGWDKPTTDKSQSGVCAEVSDRSYGHTGFTGAIMWIDPDSELIYIFLSNRVYPDSDNKILGKLNVRPDIQKVIYNSIFTSCKLPDPVTK